MKETISLEERDTLAQTLKAALGNDLRAAVLFGSRARGDAAPDSDWDVLLVVDGLPANPFQRRMLLKQRLPDRWRARIALMAYSPQEFSQHVSSLFLSIAEDGAILYDRDGLARRRLEDLRAEMRRRGALRQRTGNGEVWRGMSSEAWDALLAHAEVAS